MNNFEQNKIDVSDNLNQEFNFEAFLNNNGFTNLQEADIRSSNKIYFGEKEGKDIFLKQYLGGSDKSDVAKKSITEIDCYNNLTGNYLLKMVESDLKKGYLALEKVNLEKINLNEQSVKDVLDLYLEKMIGADASFLPERDDSQYLKLFEKIKRLESEKIINNGNDIIQKFENKQKLINEAPKFFSHGDYNLSNIKKGNNRLVVFDFEYAARDNAMVDVATFYIDLSDNTQLRECFLDTLQKFPLYNEELFDLMVIRRCILVINALANDKESPYFQKNLVALESTCRKFNMQK